MLKEQFATEALHVIARFSNPWEINAVWKNRTNISEPWVSMEYIS